MAADKTISFAGQQLQLLPGAARTSYARAHVHVREHLDGGLSVTYQGATLAVTPAPATAPVLRARTGRRPLPDLSVPHKPGSGAAKPSPKHPWRTYALTTSLSS